ASWRWLVSSASCSIRISHMSRRRAPSTGARPLCTMTDAPASTPTLGLILAGGLARRMGGGDKPRMTIGGVTILSRVLERMAAQCARLVLNANGDPARFADTGLSVIADDVPDFAGPLAGVLAGLDWAAANAPEFDYVATVPGDCPFLPRD